MGRKTLLITAITTLATLVFCTSVAFLLLNKQSKEKIPYPYEGDLKMWENIFNRKTEQYELPQDFIPQGAIIPHHIIMAHELNKFYKTLSLKKDIKTFIILSPNHYQEGNTNIQTCLNCIYSTTNQDLKTNKNLVEKLIKTDLAKENGEIFKNEHGIYSHSQFIKHYFPEAKIVPIIFKWDTSKEELENIANWLSENTNQNDTFFIASVDFSHYIKFQTAQMHDLSSWTSIYNFDFDNIFDLEIDSPASIYTILRIMSLNKNKKTIQLANTNTQNFLKESIIERTTSHQFIVFGEGTNSPEKLKNFTTLVFTKIFLDKNLKIFNSWIWQPNQSGTQGNNENIKDIRGEEDRFLTGADLIIFDLEKHECRQYTINSNTISVCKTDEKNTETFMKKTDFLFIISENITAEKAKKLIEQGADVIIDKNDIQEDHIESYKGKYIIYSLKKAAGIIFKNNTLKVETLN